MKAWFKEKRKAVEMVKTDGEVRRREKNGKYFSHFIQIFYILLTRICFCKNIT